MTRMGIDIKHAAMFCVWGEAMWKAWYTPDMRMQYYYIVKVDIKDSNNKMRLHMRILFFSVTNSPRSSSECDWFDSRHGPACQEYLDDCLEEICVVP